MDEPSVRPVGVETIATVRVGFALRQNFHDQWCMSNSGELVLYETSSDVRTVIRLVGGRTDWFGTVEVPGLEMVLAEKEAAVVLVMVVVVVVVAVAGAGQSASSYGSMVQLMRSLESIIC
uniref:Uncharacterized protein n=1 Tax=Anopheles merus TaxID=30066 RepID=A0A182V4F3_ANOME